MFKIINKNNLYYVQKITVENKRTIVKQFNSYNLAEKYITKRIFHAKNNLKKTDLDMLDYNLTK
jgi:hypothetical protein